MQKLQHSHAVVNAGRPAVNITARKGDDIVRDRPFGPFYVPPERRPKPLPRRKESERPRVYIDAPPLIEEVPSRGNRQVISIC